MSFEPGVFPLDVRQGIITLHARLYGPQACRLIRVALDTGASYTVISPRIISELGYGSKKYKRRVVMTTASGTIAAPLVALNAIQCLGQKISAFRIACHDLPSELMIEGLLGLDFLRRFDVYLRF